MKYAAKKIGLMLLTMVIVSFLAFLAFQVIPGDPAVKLLGTEATPERIAALRAEMGLDRPFLERYVQWVLGALRGDFGTSYSYKMPVSSMLAGKLPVTGLLTGMSFVLILAFSRNAPALLSESRFSHALHMHSCTASSRSLSPESRPHAT